MTYREQVKGWPYERSYLKGLELSILDRAAIIFGKLCCIRYCVTFDPSPIVKTRQRGELSEYGSTQPTKTDQTPTHYLFLSSPWP